MQRLKILFGIIFLLMVVAAFFYQQFLVNAQLERGKQVFLNYCQGCHGVDGNGKGPAAAAISGAKPRDFTKEDFKYGSSSEELFKTISQGVPGTVMPPWSSLTAAERQDVITYIKALKK